MSPIEKLSNNTDLMDEMQLVDGEVTKFIQAKLSAGESTDQVAVGLVNEFGMILASALDEVERVQDIKANRSTKNAQIAPDDDVNVVFGLAFEDFNLEEDISSGEAHVVNLSDEEISNKVAEAEDAAAAWLKQELGQFGTVSDQGHSGDELLMVIDSKASSIPALMDWIGARDTDNEGGVSLSAETSNEFDRYFMAQEWQLRSEDGEFLADTFNDWDTAIEEHFVTTAQKLPETEEAQPRPIDTDIAEEDEFDLVSKRRSMSQRSIQQAKGGNSNWWVVPVNIADESREHIVEADTLSAALSMVINSNKTASEHLIKGPYKTIEAAVDNSQEDPVPIIVVARKVASLPGRN